MPPSLFLSHTTRDQRDYALAQKLAEGLKARGVKVWIAPDSIPSGERWEEHLVSGVMEQCTHFLVILSAASTTAEWFLEEIQLAKKRYQQDPGFKILPLSVGKIGDYRNASFINKFQWIPYHDIFQVQLEAVCDALGLELTMPQHAATIIADKTRDFVGREYVFAAIDTFLNSYPNGYFVIEGVPGAGKSAILAEYAKRNGSIAYFNVRAQGINTARHFLENVCTQLITRYRLPYTSLPPDGTQDGAFLFRLLDEVSQQLVADQRLVIAVDALDEVNLDTHPAGSNILFLPSTLPNAVCFLLTRRQVDVPFTVNTPQELYNLNQHRDETIQDVEVYVRRAIQREILRAWLEKQSLAVETFVSILMDKSEGNFMYLRYVLSEIEHGDFGDLNVANLPKGLEGYYEDHWRRMGMMATPLPRIKIRIVYILSEVRQPVSRKLIAQFASDVELEVDELSVQEVLNEWDQFLHEDTVTHGTRYSIYHASFRDFLHRKDTVQAAGITLQAIHALIADELYEELFPDDRSD